APPYPGVACHRVEDAVGLPRMDALDVPACCLAAGPGVRDEHHGREAAQCEGTAAPSAPASGAPRKVGHRPWHPLHVQEEDVEQGREGWAWRQLEGPDFRSHGTSG